jgi:hypothetical protein
MTRPEELGEAAFRSCSASAAGLPPPVRKYPTARRRARGLNLSANRLIRSGRLLTRLGRLSCLLPNWLLWRWVARVLG